ncbi:MAG: hypothetical protein AAF682_08155 [Planctomycetota bacterium]
MEHDTTGAEGPPAPPGEGALTATETLRVERVAKRLLGELRRLCRYAEPEQRGGSALARTLRLDRSTCQRVTSALAADDEGVAAVLALPGPDACRAFVEACGALEASDEDVESALQACADYHALVREIGRSKAGLTRRLEASRADSRHAAARGPLSPAEYTRARERHFAASAELAGRWSELHSYVWCYRPDPEDAARVQAIGGFLLGGHESRIEAVPLLLSAGFEKSYPGGDRLFSTLSATEIGADARHVLLPDLSSSPLPRITARQREETIEYLVSTDETSRGRPTDIAMAHRATLSMTHPAAEDPPILEVWYMSTYPTQHLILDVYLDAALARSCMPSVALHGHSTHLVTVEERWNTELPQRPPLRLLPRGVEDAGSTRSPRQPELVRALLQGAGWSENGLIGYRCEIEYPIWRVGHLMVFRFDPLDPAR